MKNKEYTRYAIELDGEVIGYSQEYELTVEEQEICHVWFEALWYSLMWRN